MVSNPKLSSLADAFTGTSINTGLWNSITSGAATLDATNDLVVLAQPTINGSVNTFGTTLLFDATSGALYAEVGPSANGNGHTNTAFKLLLDSNNSVAIRLNSGVLNMTVQTAGTTVTTQLATTFDPNAHGWWRLRESSGSWNADVSADGYNWTTLSTQSYSWSPTAVQFVFQTSSGATEVAGNAATIAHVNTMAIGPTSRNLNWPTLEDAVGFRWSCNGGDLPLDRYTAVTPRTMEQSSVSRGKQYEIDQVRSGEAAAVLANTDAALDPVNAAGPYYGHIMPYQPWRRRAQWPPSRNLLTQVQATAGDLGGQSLGTINGSSSGPSIFTGTDATGGSFVASSSAWQGGTVMQFSVPTTATAGAIIADTPQPAVSIGVTYTVSLWVRNITPSTSVQVYAALRPATPTTVAITTFAGTTTTLTGSATAAWTQITVTATMPAGTAYALSGVFLAASPAATCSVQVDGWQLEQAAAPSQWCCPGDWFGIFGGFTEEWPSSWDMAGTYGTIQPTGVDAMALLSQVTLNDPLTEEISFASPRFLYTLGDASDAAGAVDQTGNYPMLQANSGKYGPGSLTFGDSITSASAGGTYLGSSGTVVTVNNPNPGTNTIGGATFLSLTGAGITGPGSTAWTRMVAFRYTGPTPSLQAFLWSAMDTQRSGGNPSGSHVYLYIDNTGRLQWGQAGSNGAGLLIPFPLVNVADSNWHLAFFGHDPTAGNAVVYLDGALLAYPLASTYAASNIAGDNLGGFVDITVGLGTTYNYKGDLSFAAEFPTMLSNTQMGNIYTAWKTACAGEASDDRYSRILRYAGYRGLTNLQSGVTTSMGPATDITGVDALSALQGVVDTESGQHFADSAGTVTFQSRGARYNALTPVYTFGENPGEWPYEDCQLSYDPTHIGNLVQVTQYSSNQVFQAQDVTSQTDYFPRTLTRTINASDPTECQAAAYYLLSRYKQPATRVSSLVLHPSANPAMWPVCLSLELGMRVQVNRRPPSPAPMISIPCFIENIAVAWDDGGEATWTLQLSPVDLTPYALFSSFHTTLHSAVSSGATSITINAGADNVNVAASQLYDGQQLVLGQNTANQETVTIAPGGVASTSTGWSTCVIALAAATTKSHAANDVVCEPLPSGVTDPTTWDAVSEFDATCFAY